MALIDHIARPTRLAAPRTGVIAAFKLFALWRSRRALARLDAAQLADIGLSAAVAQKEASKPIWDVPASWRD